MIILDIALMTLITVAIVALLGRAIMTSNPKNTALSAEPRPRPRTAPAPAPARSQRASRRAAWTA